MWGSRAACTQEAGKQGCGVQKYRAVVCGSSQLWRCRIREHRAAGCGMHGCRMRDVGTREAGYGLTELQDAGLREAGYGRTGQQDAETQRCGMRGWGAQEMGLWVQLGDGQFGLWVRDAGDWAPWGQSPLFLGLCSIVSTAGIWRRPHLGPSSLSSTRAHAGHRARSVYPDTLWVSRVQASVTELPVLLQANHGKR